MSWPTKKLGDLVSFFSGFAWKSGSFSRDECGLPIIRIQNVDGSANKSFVYWPDRYDERFVIRSGDILLTLSGSFRVEIWNGADGLLNQRIVKITPRDDVDRDWLLHFLRSVLLQIEKMGRHALVNNVALSDLRDMHLKCPPPPEQRRIAGILDQTDGLRRLRRKSLIRLADLIASLATSASLEPGGKTMPLQDVFWFQEGPGVRNWQFVDEGVKLLNVSNVTTEGDVDLKRSGNRISYQEAQGKYAHFLVDAGDLLMPCSGIPIDTDGLLRTRAAFADASHLPLCMNTSTIRFKAKREPRDLIFLRSWLQTEEFRQQITKLVTGTAQKNFGPSHLKQINVTLPSKLAMAKLEDEMGMAEILKAEALRGQDRLDNLFTSLQHRAFNGEL